MIKLNCDMGEGMEFDSQIMPLVDMANLACGLHAGSPELIRSNILLAQSYGVEIGAHPSYPDREHFGRISMALSATDLAAVLQYQIGAIESICRAHNTTLSYVKPHGALYNDMMRDERIFETIIETISLHNPSLRVMILSSNQNEYYSTIASRYGIELIYELFADRNYTDDGALVPRGEEGAVIESTSQIVKCIEHYKEHGEILSIHQKPLSLSCDSLCVHGDNESSLAIIKALRDVL